MEEKTSVKINTLEVLEKQLAARAKKGQYGIIVISSATDPYLQFEKDYELTRGVLELVLKYRFPVHIITKSDLVLRDLDLLAAINDHAILPVDLIGKLPQKAIISFSFSTIDNEIGKIFEPGAPSPERRMAALKTVLQAGFLSGVSLMPLLPYITDTTEQLDKTFRTFAEIGVQYIFPATITLFGNGVADSKTLMFRAIEKHYPELLRKYERLFANGNQMPAYYADAFYKKMKEMCAAYGLRDRIL
jgi:DNA repair photolyase